MTNVPLPQFTDGVDLRYFVEPLNAPAPVHPMLERFPDTLYNKGPDAHFTRFMYALLGPVGVGWLKYQLLQSRLLFEAAGADLGDLDNFYAVPFSFGRLPDESYDNDTTGLLASAVWNEIRAADASYRSRAIEFLQAARLGTTPAGMAMAASAGLGAPCDVVENYRYLFDAHSDAPLGLAYLGSTYGLGEFIVLPRPSESVSEQQLIAFSDATELPASYFFLSFNGVETPSPPLTYTSPYMILAANATAAQVQTQLQLLPTIGAGNCVVTGGPVPADLLVTFTGALSNQDVPLLVCQFLDANSIRVDVPVAVITGAIDPAGETVVIGDANRYSMQSALDALRPVASYPTTAPARSMLAQQAPLASISSTQHAKVVRYVTGNPAVTWPAVDNVHWIIPAQEVEAPQLHNDDRQHYVGWHNVSTVFTYTDAALGNPAYEVSTDALAAYNSVHVGPFPEMTNVMPYFTQFTDPLDVFAGPRALAEYAELLTVTAQAETIALINNIYPADYWSLQGVPQLTYPSDNFWSSVGRTGGAEFIEIDLGQAQAVNYVMFETTRKPVDIALAYDSADQAPARNFVPVSYLPQYAPDNAIFYDPSAKSPWVHLQYFFDDGLQPIYTRYLRITVTRRPDASVYGRFLFNAANQVQSPWSVELRNLRIGRTVPPNESP